MVRLIQKNISPNRGEQRMQQMLLSLPDEWVALSELRIAHRLWKNAAGLGEKRPDFIVLAPELGLLAIEVKDWNISRNQYVCINQHWIRRDPDGTTIENPWYQAWVYEQDLKGIVSGQIWVTSIVAFPLLRRAEFLNRVARLELLRDPQGQKLVSIKYTLFADDADARRGGLRKALLELVHANSGFRSSSESDVQLALERLIPPEFIVGDASEQLHRDRQQLRLLSDQQRQIAFSLSRGKNYYLDLAGSGKTNILVSRALHLVHSRPPSDNDFNILILTHSSKLARSIRLMLNDKLRGDQLPSGTRIDIKSLDEVLKGIVSFAYGVGPEELDLELETCSTTARRERLLQMFADLGPSLGDTLKGYDALLVDEVQDIGKVLKAVTTVLLRGDELFLTGDLAQRIIEWPVRVDRLGIEGDQRIPSKYLMYRCPPAIAEMAHRFVTEDRNLSTELANYGYGGTVQFRGTGQSLPEAVPAKTADEEDQLLLRAISRQRSDGIQYRDILIATSDKKLHHTRAFLAAHGIEVRTEPSKTNGVLVVTHAESKGLEGEVVILTGVEDLPTRHDGLAVTVDANRAAEKESLSRRLVYIAITRTTSRLIWLFHDESHPLVESLRHHALNVVRKRSSI